MSILPASALSYIIMYMSMTHSTNQVSVADLRAHMRELLDDVKSTHARYAITNNGKPEAVLISFDELESLEETLDILRDPEEYAAIREGLAAADAGDLHTLEQVREDLGL